MSPSICFIFVSALVLALQSRGASAGVQIRVNFMYYSNPGGLDAHGQACDPGNGACDPLFTITLSTPDGRQEKVTTDRVSDQNHVSFGSTVVNIANPVVIQRVKYEGQFSIQVKVDDFDPIGSWDYMGTFAYTFVGTPGANADFRNIREVTLSDDGRSNARLSLQIAVACLPNYYTASCTRLCIHVNDDTNGHYNCDMAGNPVCLPTYDPSSNCRLTYCANRAPCKNSGVCVNQDTGFACRCVGLWGGSTCESKLSACDSADTPCRNNGTCIPGTGSSGCICAAGFNGTFCESDIDECERRPSVCQQASECRNQFGSYSCRCLVGWTGKNCSDDINECESGDACFNGGTCDNSPPGNFTCRCRPGFSGHRCEFDVDECVNASDGPCRSDGSQVCRNLWGSYACLCAAGWSGLNCTERYLTEAEMAVAERDRLMIGLLVPAVLLLVAGVVAFFAYRLILRRRRLLESRLNDPPRRPHSSSISVDNTLYSNAIFDSQHNSHPECLYEDAEAHYSKVQSLPRDAIVDDYADVVGHEEPPNFKGPPLPPKRNLQLEEIRETGLGLTSEAPAAASAAMTYENSATADAFPDSSITNSNIVATNSQEQQAQQGYEEMTIS